MKTPRSTASQSLRRPITEYSGEPGLSPKSFAEVSPANTITLQGCSCGGGSTCTCGSTNSQNYVYALGSVQTAFPSLSIEKEFYQAVDASAVVAVDSATSSEPGVPILFSTLSKSENFYIAREMCWLLRKDGIGSFIILPRSYNELTGLIQSIAPRTATDFDVVIGVAGPMASPDMCNGAPLPTIICDEAYNFTDQEYIDAISKEIKRLQPTIIVNTDEVSRVFFEILRLADNTGDADRYRAINFLVVRYLAVYVMTYYLAKAIPPYDTDPDGYALSRVNVEPSPIQGVNKIMDIIFTYIGRSTNVMQRFFCRVDVTGEFPFLVIPWGVYYTHP